MTHGHPHRPARVSARQGGGPAHRSRAAPSPGRAEARVRVAQFYDVGLPNLAPSEALLKRALQADDAQAWRSFVRGFRAEMKRPEASRVLDLLAALSHGADFSVGCYGVDGSALPPLGPAGAARGARRGGREGIMRA